MSVEGAFDGYENLLEMSKPHSIFQNAAQFIDPEIREGGDTVDKIKDTIIKKCINYFCRENQYVIDLFTKGMVSMHAIKQLRRVVSLVTTNQEAIEVESKCVHIASKDVAIKVWAGIDDKGASAPIGLLLAPIADPDEDRKSVV